jgi:hypothetical protein
MADHAFAAETSTLARSHSVDRWFYIGTAFATIITAVAGFGPSIVNTSGRKAPLTTLVAVHGILFMAWLVVFLLQTTLVATRRIAMHRRIGAAAALLAVSMIVSGYLTSLAMARRGFDLSGDANAQADPFFKLVFSLGDLVIFGTLLLAGYWYRRRGDIHKRLMLFATVGGLMPAPLAHLIGHLPSLRAMGVIIVVPIALFLFAGAVYDRISLGRIHPVSLWVAVTIFVYDNLLATVIGPSAAWHRFAGWLVR